MKRIVFCVLSFILTTTAVANADSVQAPKVFKETRLMLDSPAPLEFPSPLEIKRVIRDSIVATLEAENAGTCPQWAGLAYDIGWPIGEIPKLLRIMFRESRCLPEACSQSDSGRVCRDWGLMQINDYSWKRTITNQGMVMRDMWNPELNLRFALWLWTYSEDRNGDGWQPWNLPHK